MRIRRQLVAAGLVMLAAHGCSRPVKPQRIILVVVDTLRRDALSCYDPSRTTPHTQALADRGRAFNNAAAAFHQTSMSMASLFSGRTPSIASGNADEALEWTGRTWCGLARFARSDSEHACVPTGVPLLAETLAAAGYATAGIASNALLFAPAGYERGFQDWIEVGRRGAPRDGAAVNRAVADWLGRRPSDGFFLYVHYMDAHDWVVEKAPPQETPPAQRERYQNAVAAADAAVGELMGMLDRDGLLHDAVVVLTADHGESLREDTHLFRANPQHIGNPSFEPVLSVPLVVAPAVVEDHGRMIRTDDVTRMIERLAGVPGAPATADLRPEELFLTEIYYRSYRDGRWKSLWPRPSASIFRRPRSDFVPRDATAPILFDLKADPGERHDVAAENGNLVAAHQARIAELERALAAPEARPGTLSPDDRERLRALGYLE